MAVVITYNNRLVDMNNNPYVAPITTTLNDGLYAVYKGESNANDSLGLYDATAIGGLTYASGKSGNAFVFNGTNAYISLPNNSLNVVGDFSYSMWVNLQGVGGDVQMLTSNVQINSGATAFWGWELYVQGSTLYIYLFDGTSSYDTFTTPIGSYYYSFTMFSVTLTGNSVKLYINGSLANTFTKTKTVTYATNHYPCIGVRHNNASAPFEYYMKNGGKIDEVYIWSRGLTGGEVTELYNSGFGKFYPYT